MFGNKLRSVLVTAFADYPKFKHIPEIDNVNQWGSYQSQKSEL